MGASSSKPADSVPTHVWKGSSPASASHDMVESLQFSSETDSTRAQQAEAHVQARVASELRRLKAEEEARLSQLTEKLSAETAPEQTPTSRHVVSKEIKELKERLESRRLVKEVPESVEEARSEVVRCLRENDRRPLDCWKEVERFREEVRRLEKGWVERVVS